MSGVTVGTVAAYAAIAGTAYSIYSGEKSASAQANAQDQAVKRASANNLKQQQAFNKANQKRPNTSNALAMARQAGNAGQSGTMLTGSQGASPTAGQLGKTTLLGG